MKHKNDKYYTPKTYDEKNDVSAEVTNSILSKFDDSFFLELERENKRFEGVIVEETPKDIISETINAVEDVKEETFEEDANKVSEIPLSEPVNVVDQKEKHYYSVYDEIAERRRKSKQGLGLYKNTEDDTESNENVNEIHSNSVNHEDYFNSDAYDVEDDGAYVGDTYHKKSHKGIIITVVIIALVLLIGGAFAFLYFNGNLDGLFESTPQAIENVNETVTATETPTEEVTTLSDDEFIKSTPTDNNQEGVFENNLFIWNDQVFELFYGTETSAKDYAKAINKCAKSFGDNVSVYSMLVPTSTEIKLPQRFTADGTVESNSQAEFISNVYSNFNDNVTSVNCYNQLSQNVKEYIYFVGDRNWTGLGGYFGYKAFAEKAGLPELNLNTCTLNSVEGYYGALTLGVNAEIPTDTVNYYTLPYETENTIYEDVKGNGVVGELYYSGAEGGKFTYSLFLHDNSNPLCVIKSQSSEAKGKILVVKDSLGNAFAPFLTYNYAEVHVVDAAYAAGDINLTSYAEENDIDTVLFIGSTRTASFEQSVDNLNKLIK